MQNPNNDRELIQQIFPYIYIYISYQSNIFYLGKSANAKSHDFDKMNLILPKVVVPASKAAYIAKFRAGAQGVYGPSDV